MFLGLYRALIIPVALYSVPAHAAPTWILGSRTGLHMRVPSIGDTKAAVFEITPEDQRIAALLESKYPGYGKRYLQVLGQIPPSQMRDFLTVDAETVTLFGTKGGGKIDDWPRLRARINILEGAPAFPVRDVDWFKLHYDKLTLAAVDETLRDVTRAKLADYFAIQLIPPYILENPHFGSESQQACAIYQNTGVIDEKLVVSIMMEGHTFASLTQL